MIKKFHGKYYWKLVMTKAYFDTQEPKIRRIFYGWHYSCVSDDYNIYLLVWKGKGK